MLNPRSSLADQIALLESEVPPQREPAPALPRPAPSRPSGPAVDPGDGDSPGAAPRTVPVSGTSGPVARVAARSEPKEPSRPEAGDTTAAFNRLDQNGDAKVTEAELPDPMKPVLSRMDTNGDKAIDREEWNKGARAWLEQSEARSHSGGGQ